MNEESSFKSGERSKNRYQGQSNEEYRKVRSLSQKIMNKSKTDFGEVPVIEKDTFDPIFDPEREPQAQDLSWSEISKIPFFSGGNNLSKSKHVLEGPKSPIERDEEDRPSRPFRAISPRNHKNRPKYPLNFKQSQSPFTPEEEKLAEFFNESYSREKLVGIAKSAFQELMTDNLLHTLNLDEASKKFIIDRITEVVGEHFEKKLNMDNYRLRNEKSKIEKELGKMDELVKELAKANDRLEEDVRKKESDIEVANKRVLDMTVEVQGLKKAIDVNGKSTSEEVRFGVICSEEADL